ncbi:MAG: phosphatase PAP2 family protein [Pseudomonadota bacterium]|nr:phosphatase PAP2 family protein [Pseudomonadota bacterium]
MTPRSPAATARYWWLWALAAVALAVILIWVAGDAIEDGAQFAFDRNILLWARGGVARGAPIGPAWFRAAMLDVTALGGVTALVLIVLLVSGFLAIQRHWLTLALVLGGTISGSIAVSIVKVLVGRARPQITDHLVQVSSLSFPSGHAANSAIVYLTLATLIDQIVEGRAARLYILAATALLVTGIGFSRIYLGVHWPSDVLAGWAFGTLWAIGWWAVGAALRQHRAPPPR